jgi:hypothetical protein
MIKRSSGTEDVFVREMILHGRPLRAIKAAFPLMQNEYLHDAVDHMMSDPDIKRRIDAGILYYYKDCFDNIEIPELAPLTLQEQRDFLFKIISGKRKYPVYIRTERGLNVIMAKPEPAIVNDALYMYGILEEMAAETRKA